ncbi:Hypothetical predicted protein [Paramuricea clavata]|uniref:Uncharacterized protein n=1 Tax=Paramuricea clavata TaxID=317549 RepID=A0A7D9K2I9_PARCT|nr:Hypothetical predicted protein [Paramuricea clavata]
MNHPRRGGKALLSCDVPPKIIPKETLLQALKRVENAIKKHGDDSLRKRLENLRGQVQDLLEDQEKENKNLWDEINSLKKEVENQKTENEKLQKELAVGEATQLFQAHLARFVVDSSEKIYPRGNSKRFGKLAWEFKESLPNFDAISIEHGEALEELKKLLPNPGSEDNVTVLDYDIAKLHIPDFLPKRLWKHGIEIVENYETKVRI